MKKITVDIGKISKGMRLKYSLILDPNTEQTKNPYLNMINRYSIGGNEFIKINPHPFLTIDISESFGKKEEWSNNKSVNLNLISEMKLESQLKKVISTLEIPNLFYYHNRKLVVNRDVAKTVKLEPFVIGNKTCLFDYIVISDDKNNEYEGVVFMINSADNFCTLTVDEITYLYYTLLSLNLYNLTFSVLTYYSNLEEKEKIDVVELNPEIIQEKKEPVPQLNRVPEYEDLQMIPNFNHMMEEG